MKVSFSPTFVRVYKNFPKQLQEEVKEKISLFECNPKHPFLKTHKLKGKLKGINNFSVNYKYRIVFQYISRGHAVLLIIGDHDIYH